LHGAVGFEAHRVPQAGVTGQFCDVLREVFHIQRTGDETGGAVDDQILGAP